MSKKVMVIIGVAVGLFSLCICAGLVGYFATQTQERNEEFAGIFPACDGEAIPSSAIFDPNNIKAIGVQTRDEGDYFTMPNAVPNDMQADTLAETSVILCAAASERVLLEECEYFGEDDRSDMSVIERYQYEQTVYIVETHTGKTIARTTLQGTPPEVCADEEFFDNFETLVVREGGEVENGDMATWFGDNISKKK